jgi:acyl carrier protein
MTPSSLVWHESLPLTRNGKVDRAALLAAAPSTVSHDGDGARANTELEQELAGMWASVLRVPEGSIPPDLDFYELGGESLAAARILTKVRKRFGVGITLERMHEMRTVRAMAAHVEAAGRAS